MSRSLFAPFRCNWPRAGEPIASAQLRHLGGLRTPEPSGRHSRADQTCALRTRLHSRSCPRSGRRMAAVRRRTELRGFHRRLAAVSVQVLSCRTCRIVSLARLASCPDVPRRSAGGSAVSVSSVCLAGVSRQSPPWCDSAGPCQFAVRGVIFSCLDWLSRGGRSLPAGRPLQIAPVKGTTSHPWLTLVVGVARSWTGQAGRLPEPAAAALTTGRSLPPAPRGAWPGRWWGDRQGFVWQWQ